MSEEAPAITTVELKRYAYCPRIVYFTHVLHLHERETEAMDFGGRLHGEAHVTPLLRALKAKRLIAGPELASKSLPLAGRPDYVIVTRFGEHVPVEVKWAEPDRGGGVKRDHRMQLAAYAILLEEAFNVTVKRGAIYYARVRRALVTPITGEMKEEAREAVEAILGIIESEGAPGVRQPMSKCINCGYVKYCLPLARRSRGKEIIYKQSS